MTDTSWIARLSDEDCWQLAQRILKANVPADVRAALLALAPKEENNVVACVNCKQPVTVTALNAIRCEKCAPSAPKADAPSLEYPCPFCGEPLWVGPHERAHVCKKSLAPKDAPSGPLVEAARDIIEHAEVSGECDECFREICRGASHMEGCRIGALRNALPPTSGATPR